MMPDRAIGSSGPSGSGGSSTLTVGLPPVGPSSGPIDEREVSKQNLLLAYIYPMKPKQVNDFRLFTLVPAPEGGQHPKHMKIYFSPTTIQDTFSNLLTENFMSQILRTSEKLGQVAQTMGYDSNDIKHMFEKGDQLAGSYVPFYNTMKNMVGEKFRSGVHKVTDALSAAAAGERFDFPKMWQDSQMEVAKDIQFKLYCSNPSDDGEFYKSIVKPLENILKFVLPMADGDDHYKWPDFCKVKAPGLFYLPEAMVTNVVINKGEGINFGSNNRPNVVDVTMQVTAIRNVMVNDYAGGMNTKLRFKLTDYVNGLQEQKSVKKIPLSPVASSSSPVQSTKPQIPPKTVNPDQKRTADHLRHFGNI